MAITAGLALFCLAAASSVLVLVGKNPPQMQAVEYNGPSLSYYINKFKSSEIIQAAVPSQTESSSSIQPGSSAPEVSQIQVESQYQPEPSASTVNSVS